MRSNNVNDRHKTGARLPVGPEMTTSPSLLTADAGVGGNRSKFGENKRILPSHGLRVVCAYSTYPTHDK